MERILSSEERIRRAEEIYYRRRNKNSPKEYARESIYTNKKEHSIAKKMILQIIVCTLIYLIVYMIQNNEYIFSKGFLEKTNQILSYDINIPQIYNKVKEYINSELNISEIENTDSYNENQEVNMIEEINIQNENKEIIIQKEVNEENTQQDENIGGEEFQSNLEEPEQLTRMQQDAKDILSSKSIIIPLKGTITSRFGERESTNPIVSKNHTGIDIGVNEGTVFIAAMSGKVEEVSSLRSIGKSCSYS